MQQVHWTPDLAEAHIVTGLLRANGLRAWAFDTAFVRQDWFKTLAFGGYRVMATNADAHEACRVVAGWRAGDFELPPGEVDLPACPYCGVGSGIEDKAPRRRIFLLLIASDVLLATMLLTSSTATTAATMLVIGLAMLPLLLALPGVPARLLTARYRCMDCRRPWRAPRFAAWTVLARHAGNGVVAEHRHTPSMPEADLGFHANDGRD